MLTARLIEGPTGDVYRDLPHISVEIEDNFIDVGGWIVECPGLDWISDAWENRPTGGLWMRIIDSEDPDAMFGGWVEEYDDDDDTITFAGMNANGWLAGLLSVPEPPLFAYPTPPRTNYSFNRSGQTASESIYDLVYSNLGAGNVADPRYLPVSTSLAALQTIGGTVALESIPNERLIETVRRWGLLGGLAVDFGYDNGGVSLDIRTPQLVGFRLAKRDGVLKKWGWRETGPAVTAVAAAGDGEGVTRRIQDAGNFGAAFDYSGWGNRRKEAFVDAGTADAGAAIIEGYEALREGQATSGVQQKAITSRLGVRYKTNYELGDIVGVVFRGVEYLQLITSVVIKWDRRGRTEEIGTGQPEIAGVTLGRQTPYNVLSPSGISVGQIRPRSLYDTDQGDSAPLEFEIVYSAAPGDPSNVAHWRVERSVDGGQWATHIASSDLDNDTYQNDWEPFDFTLPAYAEGVEARVVLTSPLHGSKTTPSFLVAGARPALTLSAPAGPYLPGEQQNFTFTVPYDMGVDSTLRLERAPQGTEAWEIEPGRPVETFPAGFAAQTFTGAVTVSAGTWRWRAVTVDGYSVVNSAATEPVTVASPVPSVPAAPVNFTAAISSGTAVFLDWDRPLADPGVPAASSIEIGYRISGGTWQTLANAIDPNVSASGIDNSPASGATWEYRVRFVNTTGVGAWSPVIEVTFPDTSLGYWASEDGGRWQSEDGGHWLAEDQT